MVNEISGNFALAGLSGKDGLTQVLPWFEAKAPLTPEGTTLMAEALLSQGDAEQAKALVRQGWITLSFSGNQESLYRSRFASWLTHADDLARFDSLVWERKSSAAMRHAKRLGQGYTALARARIRLAARRPGVDAAIKQVPDSLQDDPGLVYDRLLWRTRKHRYDDVLELLQPIGAEVPHKERWWPIRTWAARQALRDDDPALAYELVTPHGLDAGVGFAESEWLAGWISLRRLNRPAQAYDHFAELYNGVTTVISRARGAYWAGRAAAAMDQRELAHKWYLTAAQYNTAFYGQLAKRALPEAVAALGGSSATARRVVVSDADRAAFHSREVVQVVHLLGRLDARKLQATFLRHLRNGAANDQDYHLVAELADAMGRKDIALSMAKRAQNKGLHLEDYLFPREDLPTTEQALDMAPENSLVFAVIRQESAFDHRAISHAGARGLMQLMPGTAKLTAKKAGHPYSKARLTIDKNYNIKLGSHYLQSLIDDFDGSYILALAAYNAGPGRAYRWMRENGDPRNPSVDPVDWIEQIPFNETRNYVQRVLENLAVYRQRGSAPYDTWASRPTDSPS